MKWLPFLLPAISFIFLTGCDTEDDPSNSKKIIGTGPIVTETLDLQPFQKIENSGVANIYVTLGSPQSVILKAQQNIIDVLTWEVVNNTLRIGIEKNVSIERAEEIRFEIVIDKISDIGLLGVGSYELSGDFQDELSISLIGVGSVNAYDLEVGSCSISLTGVGDCRVRVRDDINVSLTGIGNVYYKGNPSITQNVTGIGNLIDDN